MSSNSMASVLALVFLFSISPLAVAQSGSVQECQRLQDRIDKYTRLRRKGGSASQMDTWKRERTRAEEAFRQLDCHWYAGQLK